MESSTLILAICRALQLLFAAVVLGTSASLSKDLTTLQSECKAAHLLCDFYGIIPAIEFGCFVGAVGLIDALAGMVSAFMDVIPYIVNLGLDALACLSYVAGGASVAALLAKFYGGCNGGNYCSRIKAEDAFQFLGFIITLVIIGLSFMWRAKSGGGRSHV